MCARIERHSERLRSRERAPPLPHRSVVSLSTTRPQTSPNPSFFPPVFLLRPLFRSVLFAPPRGDPRRSPPPSPPPPHRTAPHPQVLRPHTRSARPPFVAPPFPSVSFAQPKTTHRQDTTSARLARCRGTAGPSHLERRNRSPRPNSDINTAPPRSYPPILMALLPMAAAPFYNPPSLSPAPPRLLRGWPRWVGAPFWRPPLSLLPTSCLCVVCRAFPPPLSLLSSSLLPPNTQHTLPFHSLCLSFSYTHTLSLFFSSLLSPPQAAHHFELGGQDGTSRPRSAAGLRAALPSRPPPPLNPLDCEIAALLFPPRLLNHPIASPPQSHYGRQHTFSCRPSPFCPSALRIRLCLCAPPFGAALLLLSSPPHHRRVPCA